MRIPEKHFGDGEKNWERMAYLTIGKGRPRNTRASVRATMPIHIVRVPSLTRPNQLQEDAVIHTPRKKKAYRNERTEEDP